MGWNAYQYCRNNPLSRIDYNGFFDIKVNLAKNREQTGKLRVYDRKGNLVLSVKALGRGQHSDRMKKNGDTPLGIYDIPEKRDQMFNDWSTQIYGPNPRLVLNGESGEILESERTLIRVHGIGEHREEKDEEGEVLLKATHGCIRVSNEDMERIYNTIIELLEKDTEEYGGKLEVKEINDNSSINPGGPIISPQR